MMGGMVAQVAGQKVVPLLRDVIRGLQRILRIHTRVMGIGMPGRDEEEIIMGTAKIKRALIQLM